MTPLTIAAPIESSQKQKADMEFLSYKGVPQTEIVQSWKMLAKMKH